MLTAPATTDRRWSFHTVANTPRAGAKLRRRFGFTQLPTQPDADRRDRKAEQERHAPAPRLHLGRRQGRGQKSDQQRAGTHAQALAAELEAAKETAPRGRRIFDQQRGRRADFTAGRKTLQQPSRHQQRRSDQAQHGVDRRRRDRDAAQRHQRNGEHHRGTPAGAIGIGADHQPAERPHYKADAEAGDGQQQLRAVGQRREEQLADRESQKAVDGEIEELDGVADGDGNQGAAAVRRLVRLHVDLS